MTSSIDSFPSQFSTQYTTVSTMPSKPRTLRREHSSETIAVILCLHKLKKSHAQIAEHVKIPKSSVTTILHRQERNPDHPLRPTKRAGRPLKLDARARRTLIRHVERYPHDNFAALATPSKTGQTLSRTTVRKYLKAAGYLRFKARRKPYLSQKHKLARLKWAKEHVNWTLEDWLHVIWTDEATFETGLDTRTCYVTRRKGTAMESRYLKPTFKSGRTTIGIRGAITLGLKGPVHLSQKEGRMNSDIYVNQVLKELGLPFYERCIRERGYMLWMDDGAGYHTSKSTTKWRLQAGLIRMDWPAQSPDLNPIENLWRIIKLRVSGRRHRIHSVDEMKRAIQEEWEKLTEEDFRKCIESMPKRCRLVIKARGGSIKY